MAEYQITCVTKPDRFSRHEHITHVGNPASPWRITREEVIKLIDARTHDFFTIDPRTGAKAYVGVVREAGKAPYLRTHADGVWTDNLLALNECPLT